MLPRLMQQHREFVAAQPRQRIAIAQSRHQSRADLLQQHVAALVPERIVDVFETVQVEHQERQGCVGECPLQERLLQAATEHNAVRQAGQRIVQCLVL